MELIPGQTPLDPSEVASLIPTLNTIGELNAFEQSNIYDANVWALKSRVLKKDLISVKALRMLHLKMFDKTWRWAGNFRQTEKNIGVEVHDIQNQLGQLIGNANYWLENETYSLNEIAIRVHHKLVWIHSFPNGNGRHARLVAKYLKPTAGCMFDETSSKFFKACRSTETGQDSGSSTSRICLR